MAGAAMAGSAAGVADATRAAGLGLGVAGTATVPLGAGAADAGRVVALGTGVATEDAGGAGAEGTGTADAGATDAGGADALGAGAAEAGGVADAVTEALIPGAASRPSDMFCETRGRPGCEARATVIMTTPAAKRATVAVIARTCIP
jgi:hypothetical protein